MFLLDTNVLIAITEGNRRVLEKLASLTDDEICTSSLVEAEFRSKIAHLAPDTEKYLQRIEILSGLRIYSFDTAAAQQAAQLRAGLSVAGRNTGRLDHLIAAHAISLGKGLVTNNLKDFKNLPGLKLDNWLV